MPGKTLPVKAKPGDRQSPREKSKPIALGGLDEVDVGLGVVGVLGGGADGSVRDGNGAVDGDGAPNVTV